MPSPREQPNPPSRNRRRPETPAPGSWLWLVLLLMLVLVLLFTVGMSSGTSVMYSQFLAVAKDGKAPGKNTNIKKVIFVGPERIEGEFLEDAKLPEDLAKQMRSGRRFSVLVPEAEIRSGHVSKVLEEYAIPFGRQEESGAWIPQLLMLLLPALILLAIFFFFLLPR